MTDGDDRRAITAAMQRLFGGTPLRSSDKLDIVSLAQEAGAKRNNLTHKHSDLKDLFYAQRRTRDGFLDSSFDGFRQSQSDRHVGAGADRGADDGVPVERRSATDQGFRPRPWCGARDRFGGDCAEAVDGGLHRTQQAPRFPERLPAGAPNALCCCGILSIVRVEGLDTELVRHLGDVPVLDLGDIAATRALVSEPAPTPTPAADGVVVTDVVAERWAQCPRDEAIADRRAPAADRRGDARWRVRVGVGRSQ